MELLLVLSRVAFASFANVSQKQLSQHHHPLLIVASAYLILAALSLPLLPFLPLTEYSQSFWVNSLAAALLDMAGTLFLVLSLSKTDLSVFGPLNAYKVVISMLLALVFLHEIPDAQGLSGIAIIILGSIFLLPPKVEQQRPRLIQLLQDKGVQYRFLSILLFSIGTLPLKTAVMEGGPVATTAFWCLMGLPLAYLSYALFHHKQTPQHHAIKRDYFAIFQLGLLLFFMQLTTLIILAHTLIAYALALFQLSMVLQVILGYRIFKEQYIRRRLLACSVMIIGSLLVLNT